MSSFIYLIRFVVVVVVVVGGGGGGGGVFASTPTSIVYGQNIRNIP